MNAFLLSCVFSVENKMPGGYWSRTGTADLSGALLHQKNGTVQCRSTLAVGETGICQEVAIQMNGYVAIALGQVNIALTQS